MNINQPTGGKEDGMKLCKDCKYYSVRNEPLAIVECMHQKAHSSRINPVTGKTDEHHMDCFYFRMNLRDYCGKEALFFDPTERTRNE